MTKVCPRCEEEKLAAKFYKEAQHKDGLSSRCKKCINKAVSEYTKKNPDKHKNWVRISHLKIKYGLTIQDWDNLFQEQQGRCAICGKHQSELKKPLCVDHNHETGQIRGLVCYKCNPAIGALGADYGIELLQKAIEYVEKYQ